MRVTKHHYAIELAKLGHEVMFLEPTEASWSWNTSSFDISDSDAEGVKIMRQKINIPYNLKFHSKVLYDVFIKRHIKTLEKKIGPFDLVWSFDLTGAIPLKYFNAEQKIFFAADWPPNNDAVNAAESADLVVSVAQEILDQYPKKHKKILVRHGVAKCFIDAGKLPFIKSDEQFRIGMSGNFLRSDIDRPVLLDIIASFPNILFECFGAYEIKNSNLGGSDDPETAGFIKALKTAPNVLMHGMVSPEKLAIELRRMDSFLICYDVNKDQSKGTNYHKVSEYLVYGRLIVSNYVSAYDFEGSGVIMTVKENKTDHFKDLISNLDDEIAPNNKIVAYDEILKEIILSVKSKF